MKTPVLVSVSLSYENVRERRGMSDLRERIQAEIDGLEIALECERFVVAGLLSYQQEWDILREKQSAVPITLTRRVRQRLDSKNTVSDLEQKIADLKALLPAPRHPTIRRAVMEIEFRCKDDPEANGRLPQKGEQRFTLTFPLENGDSLRVHMGQESMNYFTSFLGQMLVDDCAESHKESNDE